MRFVAEVPDELGPLIEGAFIQKFGGYSATIPNPEPDPGDGTPWSATIPNPVKPIDFAGQCVASMILDVVKPYAVEEATRAAQQAVEAQFHSIPAITFTGEADA